MDEGLLRRYRLGQLDETERQRIETRAFEDDELDNRIEAAGDDLLDDYARGLLSPADRAAVERSFPAHRIAAARALAQRTRTQPATRSRSWTPWAAAAALALCLVPAYFWRNQPAVSQNEPAAAPKRPPVTIDFALNVPIRRGGPYPVLRIPRFAEAVAFQIQAAPGYPAYEVTVRSAQRGLVLTQTASAPSIKVQLPVAMLPPGDYDFLVSGVRNQDPILLSTYACRVEHE